MAKAQYIQNLDFITAALSGASQLNKGIAKRAAIKVAGKKHKVTIAMVFIEALSRHAAIAMSFEMTVAEWAIKF